ncbi:MAG: hypothetical protein HYU64_11170 [Armatimonadetes bacterium]|nr:hypothetical protein [Armatimonadota bacterium]
MKRLLWITLAVALLSGGMARADVRDFDVLNSFINAYITGLAWHDNPEDTLNINGLSTTLTGIDFSGRYQKPREYDSLKSGIYLNNLNLDKTLPGGQRLYIWGFNKDSETKRVSAELQTQNSWKLSLDYGRIPHNVLPAPNRIDNVVINNPMANLGWRAELQTGIFNNGNPRPNITFGDGVYEKDRGDVHLALRGKAGPSLGLYGDYRMQSDSGRRQYINKTCFGAGAGGNQVNGAQNGAGILRCGRCHFVSAPAAYAQRTDSYNLGGTYVFNEARNTQAKAQYYERGFSDGSNFPAEFLASTRTWISTLPATLIGATNVGSNGVNASLPVDPSAFSRNRNRDARVALKTDLSDKVSAGLEYNITSFTNTFDPTGRSTPGLPNARFYPARDLQTNGVGNGNRVDNFSIDLDAVPNDRLALSGSYNRTNERFSINPASVSYRSTAWGEGWRRAAARPQRTDSSRYGLDFTYRANKFFTLNGGIKQENVEREKDYYWSYFYFMYNNAVSGRIPVMNSNTWPDATAAQLATLNTPNTGAANLFRDPSQLYTDPRYFSVISTRSSATSYYLRGNWRIGNQARITGRVQLKSGNNTYYRIDPTNETNWSVMGTWNLPNASNFVVNLLGRDSRNSESNYRSDMQSGTIAWHSTAFKINITPASVEGRPPNVEMIPKLRSTVSLGFNNLGSTYTPLYSYVDRMFYYTFFGNAVGTNEQPFACLDDAANMNLLPAAQRTTVAPGGEISFKNRNTTGMLKLNYMTHNTSNQQYQLDLVVNRSLSTRNLSFFNGYYNGFGDANLIASVQPNTAQWQNDIEYYRTDVDQLFATVGTSWQPRKDNPDEQLGVKAQFVRFMDRARPEFSGSAKLYMVEYRLRF